MSLPDDCKHFISTWESTPDDKQTTDNSVARLLIEKGRMKENAEIAEHQSSSALFAKNKRSVKCSECGKLFKMNVEWRKTEKDMV